MRKIGWVLAFMATTCTAMEMEKTIAMKGWMDPQWPTLPSLKEEHQKWSALYNNVSWRQEWESQLLINECLCCKLIESGTIADDETLMNLDAIDLAKFFPDLTLKVKAWVDQRQRNEFSPARYLYIIEALLQEGWKKSPNLSANQYFDWLRRFFVEYEVAAGVVLESLAKVMVTQRLKESPQEKIPSEWVALVGIIKAQNNKHAEALGLFHEVTKAIPLTWGKDWYARPTVGCDNIKKKRPR